jgi:PelA/Pel-15E family pectate lyase
MRYLLPLLFLPTAAIPAAFAAQVIGQMVSAEPITSTRITRLPVQQQAEWNAYLARSDAQRGADKAALAAEREGIATPPTPRHGKSGGSGMPLDKPAAWYAGPEARRVADNIVSFQTPAGGWGKNVDRDGPVRLRGQFYVPDDSPRGGAAAESWDYIGTFDNNATTTEIRFLARVQAQLPGKAGAVYREAFAKGIRYILNAQFPNGGWPQIYPLQGGYHDAITYNDDAYSQVLETLALVAARQGDYAGVPGALAAEAASACERGLSIILKTQVVVGGTRTIWGQQHDALTLAPVGARNFEPAALSSYESASLLTFLMRLPAPSPEVKAAIRDGVAWLRAHAITGQEWAQTDKGRMLVARPGAGPIWSRFYDIGTGKPIFGDRDRTIHDEPNALSLERRNGYSWFSSGPGKAIAEYAKWAPLNGG